MEWLNKNKLTGTKHYEVISVHHHRTGAKHSSRQLIARVSYQRTGCAQWLWLKTIVIQTHG